MIPFSEKDAVIVERATAKRDLVQGPRLGDFVLFQTGQLERLSRFTERDGGVQTSPGGAFYLSGCGTGSLSVGGLNPPTSLDKLVKTDIKVEGEFWHFSEGKSGPGRRVTFMVSCTLYISTAPYSGYLGEEWECDAIKVIKKQLQEQHSLPQSFFK